MKDNLVLNYWNPILKKLHVIIIGAILTSILALIITLFIPKTYEAKATILPVQPTHTDIRLPSNIPSISNIQRQLPPIASHYIVNLITSRRLAEYVIFDMNLRERFGNISFEKTVKYLLEMVSVDENRYGLIEISVQAGESKLAADIANNYVRNLEKFIKEDLISTAKNQKVFLEEQITNIKRELVLAEDSLKNFKEKNKTVNLTENVKTEINRIAKLKAEIFFEENNLTILRSYSSSENPEMKKLTQKISLLKKQVEEAEENSPAIKAMPEKEMELARLTRDLKVKEEIYIELMTQYETSKIAEAKEGKLFTLLDKAMPPEKHSKPSKKMNMIFAFVGWIIISSFVIIFKSEFSEKTSLD